MQTHSQSLLTVEREVTGPERNRTGKHAKALGKEGRKGAREGGRKSNIASSLFLLPVKFRAPSEPPRSDWERVWVLCKSLVNWLPGIWGKQAKKCLTTRHVISCFMTFFTACLPLPRSFQEEMLTQRSTTRQIFCAHVMQIVSPPAQIPGGNLPLVICIVFSRLNCTC